MGKRVAHRSNSRTSSSSHRPANNSRSSVGSFDRDGDATRRQERALRRWNMLRTHVRVTRRLSQELAHKHARRFSSAQQSLVDACIGCISAPATKERPLDTLLAVREQFLSLLDAEHCVLSFEILPSSCSVIEFDGRGIRQVVEKAPGRPARRLQGDRHEEAPAGCSHVQSYVCVPLVDCSDHVRAVVEVFNSRHDPQDVTTWLGDCALLRAAAPIETFVDNPVYAHDREVSTLWARLASAGLRTTVSTVLMGQGVIGRAASTAEPLFDGDVLCVPMFDQCRDHQVNSVVVFYGMQGKKRDSRGAFRQCDVELCNVVCRHVGSSLQRLALEDAANKAQDKAQALLELSDLLFRELERSPKPAAMLLTAARAIVQKSWFRISECNVYLRDPLTHELYSPGNATQGEYRVPLSSGSPSATAAARTSRVVNLRDASSGSLSREKHAKPILAVPVRDPSSGAVLAVLELLDRHSSNDKDRDSQESKPPLAWTSSTSTSTMKTWQRHCSTGTMPGEQAGAVFSFVEAAACRALGASHGALFLVDAPSRSLFARVGADWRGYALPIGQKLQGRVAATGAAMRLVREACIHPEFDSDYDRLMGASGRSGRRCSSSFSTSSSTDEDGDDRPVIGVFYAVNKMSASGETEGFDAEDEQVLRAICVELSALVERRAWELVFESPSYDDSESSDSEGESHVTRTFLSQYTTASPVRRRRRPRSRLPSVVSDHDHAAAVVAATSIGLASSQGTQSPALQWDLDPWQFSPAQLIDLAVDMFELHDLMDGFALPEATLRRFLHSVQAQYLDVPYHNTYHAFATLHTTFLMLTAQSKKLASSLIPASTALGVSPTTKAQATERSRQKRCGELILAPRERLAVFVAAFCHDMGHDARTNDFHVRCSSRLARRYNDHSVLENMHSAACFETMRRPGNDVLAGLEDGSSDTVGSRRAVRKRIIRAILATDMHRHASIVAKYTKLKSVGAGTMTRPCVNC
ncbi:3',5'-cyclic-nucleotide phosphodiesterase regA [Phytophthora ramorum]|uniref:3',5'-cyclic-nucleotide phosphodiesterase regA n=1 Tax=Phytophthora ramorum TaxID=164328 RepID=UPI0030B59DB4|nr:3',5'-cyclic-nucleotide phosphodiesterase regA [Phytophthora ramorum]